MDIIFPKYCVTCKKVGSYLCADCFAHIRFTDGEVCSSCNRASFNGLTHPICITKYGLDGIFTGVEYKGVIKRLVYQFKYKPYVTHLSETIAELFYESLIQKETFMNLLNKNSVIFTPIPLFPAKERSRGYNHANILTVELSKRFNIPHKLLLKRVKNTKSQFQLKREERTENMKDAFEALAIQQYNNPPATQADQPASSRPWPAGLAKALRAGPTIFLVDDIVTTGSTFLEAARVLKKNGAKAVFGLAFARD